jgi:hypothetical protein
MRRTASGIADRSEVLAVRESWSCVREPRFTPSEVKDETAAVALQRDQ